MRVPDRIVFTVAAVGAVLSVPIPSAAEEKVPAPAAARREAGEARVREAREAVAREAREDRERDARMEAALKSMTERSPLRLQLTQDITADQVRVTAYAANRVRLVWPQGEIDYPVDRLPQESMAVLLGGVLAGGSARDTLYVGKLFFQNNILDRAEPYFKRAVQIDAALQPLCPDVERMRKVSRPFRGEYRLLGGTLNLNWNFRSPDQEKDFIVENGKAAVVPGKGLQLSAGEKDAVVRVRDIPFLDAVEASAVPGEAAESTLHFLGLRFIRPDGSDVFYVAAVSARLRRFLVNRIENGRQAANLVPAQNLAGEAAVKIAYRKGKVSVTVDRRVVWTEPEAGFTNVLVGLGAVGDAKAAKQAVFRLVTLSGSVNPQWVAKLTAAYQDVLSAELNKENLASKAKPGASGLAPLSVDADASGRGAALDARYRAALDLLEAFNREQDDPSFRQACQAMSALAKENPAFAPPVYYLARLAEIAGARGEAIQCVNEALRRCPEFPEALVLRAGYQVCVSQWKEARANTDRALGLIPDFAEGRLVRARLLHQDGEAAGAMEEAAVAEKLAPLDSDLRKRCRMLRNVIRGPGWAKESRHETPHYRVRSELPAAKARFYAEQLEAARSVFGQVLPLPASSAAEQRVDVLIYNTVEGYYSGMEFVQGDRIENTSGFFSPWYGQLMFYESADAEDTAAVMFHEAFHQYFSGALPAAPIWLAEGLADYAGGTRVEKGKPAELGGIRDNRLRDLKFSLRYGWKPVPFREIMTESQRDFYGRVPQLQYAQAWSMIHFFRHGQGGRWKAVLDAYVQSLAAGTPAAAAFDATFGKAGPDLETQWRSYVDGLTP